MVSEQTSTAAEGELIEAAREGSEAAFARLIEPRRGELHAHCYRMLGSVQDAEDAVQEAMLRAWRAIGRFEARSSFRSWLYKIATNVCLDQIARRPKRLLPAGYGPASDPEDGPGRPLVESVWIEPYPDEVLAVEDGYAAPESRYELREGLELAFVAAIQHLPARQRAVLILREVLGFSAREVAESLETTVAAVNSALQRARQTAGERLPERSQQETLRALGDEEISRIVERYMLAWERGDVDAVVGMLAEDALVTMPPMATWYRGREAARVFLSKWAFAKRWATERGRFEDTERKVRLLRASANGQPAIGAYNWSAEAGAFLPYAFQVLSFEGAAISQIDGFVTPGVFGRFGLPASLSD